MPAQSEAESAAAVEATLPPRGTPLTGAGGLLPPLRRSQVAPRTVVTVLLTALGVVGALYLVWLLRQPVRWLVVGVFLAVALSPLVERLHRRGLPRAASVLLVYLGLLAGLGALGVLVVPPLAEQVQDLASYGTTLASQPGGAEQALEELAARYGLGGYVEALRAQASALPGRLSTAAGPLLSLGRGLVGSLTATVSVLLIAFFLLADGERFVRAALFLFHPGQRPRMRRLLGASAGAVHGYVTGNLTISAMAGVTAFGLCWGLGVPYAVALAVIVALFDLIPLVGAMLGTGAVLLVALFTAPLWKVGVLAVALLLYQQIENNVLQPWVYGRSVSLHPLAIFFAVLAGAELLGILGALLAIPVAEILRILGAEWLASRADQTGGAVHGQDTAAPIDRVAADAVGTGTGGAPPAPAALAAPAAAVGREGGSPPAPERDAA